KEVRKLMLNIVLYEPLIPQNTGNIIRTCVGIDAKLHLIKPLGFSLDDKYLKRSGLDYFKKVSLTVYENFSLFEKVNKGHYFYFSRYGQKSYHEIDFKAFKGAVYLIFGKETTGVERTLLATNLPHVYRIPHNDKIRSLNLSNSVAIVSYEYLRQLDFNNLSKVEPDTLKGKDYLSNFKK
ncbi:MAG: tRNA (cytidine(34)-2'-O)-methyltransferase, partial [Acholeplasmataceae bacterium]|nr:tRNA (cytidine(34)-2'-O)-methyltransferase [Acholeplasmataceae bacterium]